VCDNAPSKETDITKVQGLLRYTSASMTRICDRHKTRLEENPTINMKY
jgi:hypothetical protein